MSALSLAELRQLLLTNRPRRSCDGYPARVRAAVVAAALDLVVAGWTPTALARELGLAATTLVLWLRRPVEPSFRPVTVIEPSPPRGWSSSLTLVTPGGYRVEGLDIHAVTALHAELP